jgi:hypothetical protein
MIDTLVFLVRKNFRIGNQNVTQFFFFSDQTYEALLFTTRSTIDTVRFLLSSGFQFVLTRKLNSDNIERLFSCLRQSNGGNFHMEARAAGKLESQFYTSSQKMAAGVIKNPTKFFVLLVSGITKVLRTGIVDASAACNVSLCRENKRDYDLIREKRNVEKKRAKEVLENLPDDILAILDELSEKPGWFSFLIIQPPQIIYLLSKLM